jgi:DNA repair protein RecN (Recombination protein N)
MRVLDYLRIRGLALLDDVALEFTRGMNVLTGETGAGKSIIVDALALIRGARGRAELVREGERGARVEAQFGIDPGLRDRLLAVLEGHGFDFGPDDGVVVERVVSAAGRGRRVVQGRLTTLSVLSDVGEVLIDICSQHEHHSLAQVRRHLSLLDAYAGSDELVADYTSAFEEWRASESALEDMRARASEGVQRADYLRFQIEEIERVNPQAGEYETLSARALLLRQAHRWQAFAHEAQQELYEADDAIAPRLASLLEEARRDRPESNALAELQEQLENARVASEEAATAAARLADELEFEEGELDAVEERLHDLDRLQRKHAESVEQLPARLEQMQKELAELDNVDDHIGALQDRTRELGSRCRELAQRLRERRVATAKKLSAAVEKELSVLHLKDARFEARVEPTAQDSLGPRGMDKVEFLFSANPGEPVAPLTRVASGGELSRVLLAVKGVLATGDEVATYVFDEIDAGVGGAVAEAIGRKLSKAAQRRQVLCITHLPQIAAFADAHFHVEKRQEGGRTVTRVVELDERERVEEIARMLGGAKASARKHAQTLLDEARTKPARRASGRARSRR